MSIIYGASSSAVTAFDAAYRVSVEGAIQGGKKSFL